MGTDSGWNPFFLSVPMGFYVHCSEFFLLKVGSFFYDFILYELF